MVRQSLASQMIAFGMLMTERNPWVFSALVCYVLLCFGGGFGTMPSFVADVFGARRMSVVYGAMLTAWAAAGVSNLSKQVAAPAGSETSHRCPR